jgi:GMP synthase-like glutamine amidotransferase
MRALVIANPADRNPGLVGARLVERGWRLEEADRERPNELTGPDGVDLVLSLGSDWSVYQPSVRSEVEAEAALLAAAHRRGTPVLGICWGAQILAHALGGAVGPAPVPEVGWHRVWATAGSPVPSGPWFQWHGDRFEPPPGARLLATSPRAPQAFVGGRSFAVQFHAELTEPMLARWVAGARAGRDRLVPVPDALLEASVRHWPGAAARTRRLVDWFLDEVAGRTAPGPPGPADPLDPLGPPDPPACTTPPP